MNDKKNWFFGAAKGKKGQKVLLDISASEIIDENEDCVSLTCFTFI